jgi:AcrR family transcriptional regulator
VSAVRKNGSNAELLSARSPGRPRSEGARKAILDSTLELLQETGFTDLSIESIATHAGVGKATVYRWWPNKAELVMEAFVAAVEDQLRIASTGSAEKVIREQMKRWTRVFRSPLGRVIAAVIGAGQSNPEMLEAFRHHYVEPRRTEARKLLREAMRTGEIRPDLNPDTILDILYGPLYMRLLLRHTELNAELPEIILDVVMPGLRPHKNSTITAN